MTDHGDVLPAVGAYGLFTILGLVVLAILATVIFLTIVHKDSRSGEVHIRIFHGIEFRVRWGQADERNDDTAKLRRTNNDEENRPALTPARQSSIEMLLRFIKKWIGG